MRMEHRQQDPFSRVAAVTVLSITGLGLLYVIFTSAPSGSLGLSLVSLLSKLLLIFSVAGLGVGILMYGREQFFQPLFTISKPDAPKTCVHCRTNLSQASKYCPECGKPLQELCAQCGAVLLDDWKCCPKCGGNKALTPEQQEVEADKFQNHVRDIGGKDEKLTQD